MRVRIHLASGHVVDAEQFSADNGVTWAPIEVAHVVAVMGQSAGFTVVRDAFTASWSAFRNAHIESIGPAPDVTGAIEAEVERRIAALLAERLPARVEAVVPVTPVEPPVEVPPA